MKIQLACIALATVLLSGCNTTQLTHVERFDTVEHLDLEDGCVVYYQSRRYKHTTPRQTAIIEQDLLEKGLPEKDLEHARRGKIFVGMTRAGLYAAWGGISKQNRTVTAAGTSIQHIYGYESPTYVYTRNSIVTAWQD